MFEWFHENEEGLYFGSLILIGLMVAWTVIISTANSVPEAEDLEFIQLAGLNLPELNGSITVPLNVSNAENYTMQVFSIFYCDPSELQAYVMLSTDLANYTRIEPGQTLLANVTVTEEPNKLNGEIYVRFYGLIP